MSDRFQNGQTLTAEDLNNMINDIGQLKLYQTRIKPGSSQDNLLKAGSLIGGLGVTGEKASYTNDQGSLAFGEGLITYRRNEIAFGQYNDTSAATKDIVFSIGNGADKDNRSNLFSISSDGTVMINQNKLATLNDINTAKTDINGNIKTLEDKITTQNTTIGNLEQNIRELNTNLIGFKSKYFYPVGSVYISTTNTDPSKITSDLVGKGTWELIDKEFISTNHHTESSTSELWNEIWRIQTAENVFEQINKETDSSQMDSIYWMTSGHTVRIRLKFTISQTLMNMIKTNKILEGDYKKLTIGQLILSKFGINTNFAQSLYSIPIVSDSGNCLFMCNIDNKGNIELTDYIDRAIGDISNNTVNTSIKTTEDIECYINFDILCKFDNMADSACDKFYYKRTK